MSEPGMDRIRWIFDELVEREGEDRERHLARLCGGDATLRARVEGLLAAHEQGGDVLESPSIASAKAAAAAVLDRLGEPGGLGAGTGGYVGTLIGPYKVLQVIGEGGFGTVYMAEQQAPIRRRVVPRRATSECSRSVRTHRRSP